jgi:hypothetical protein
MIRILPLPPENGGGDISVAGPNEPLQKPERHETIVV